MRIRIAFIASFLLLCLSSSLSAAEERSQVLILGKPAGFQAATFADDGSVKVHYEFNDRGRGPEIDATYQVGADAVPTQMHIAGKNYLKAPVAEDFTWADGKASWKNGADDAEVDAPKPGFYLTLNGTPEEMVMLVRALLAAPDRKIALLPAGEARLSEVAKMRVKGKPGAVDARLYAVEGLDLTPTLIWLDDKGRFFAWWSPWQATVREGYEDALTALGERQQQEDQARDAQRTKALTRVLKKPLLIANVRVFDPVTLKVAEDHAVLVDQGKIAAVGALAALSVPQGTETLDGQGMFLTPGLWDMHQHYGPGYGGLLDLAAGVTTVRDLANDNEQLAALIARIEKGEAAGPRIIRSGFIDGRGPYQGPTKVFADTVEEGVAHINQYADDGFEQVKLYSSLKPEIVPPMIAAAHKRGLRVSGHVPSFMSTREFVEAGADEIQHINFVVMSFVTDVKTSDTRTPIRFTAVAQHAAGLDLGSPEMREWVQFLVDHKTVVDPTLSTFENMFLEQPGHPGPGYAAWLGRLPPTWQRNIRAGTGGLPMAREQEALYRDSYARLVELTGVMHRAGVQLVAGTDGSAAFSLVRELELYVAAGIPPAEALRIATLGGATVMKRADRFGRIAPGYVADLALVDGDPTLNIADLRRVRTVLRGDRLYDSDAVFTALGLKAIARRKP